MTHNRAARPRTRCMAALAKIGPGSNAASPAEMAFRRFRTGIQLTDIVLLSGSGFRLFSDGLFALPPERSLLRDPGRRRHGSLVLHEAAAAAQISALTTAMPQVVVCSHAAAPGGVLAWASGQHWSAADAARVRRRLRLVGLTSAQALRAPPLALKRSRSDGPVVPGLR